MKTHELAHSLELLSRLLRQLPDTQLNQIEPYLQTIFPKIATQPKEPAHPKRKIPKEIEGQIALMNPRDIEEFLLSEKASLTAAQLSDLATQLGLTSSKRQSKSALANMITRHYEASRMHEIMRNTSQD